MEKPTWSKLARRVTPYTPGEQPQISGLIKLNTNENPYPPSPRVVEAYKNFDLASLRLYSDPHARSLCREIARGAGMELDQVFVGNGSDEVLALSFMAFFDPGATVKTPDLGYSFYPVYADVFDIPLEKVPLDEDFRIRIEDYFDSPGGVIFANPNAPTGIDLSLDEIEQILQNNKRAVIVDEAYIAFGGESAEALVAHYDNLLVVRTLSKSHSLAGLRLGYALGSPGMIQALERMKDCFNSYTVDALAQVLGEAAIADWQYTKHCSERIIASREKLMKDLSGLGFSCTPSKTNFVFATTPKMAAVELLKALREKKILVRHFAAPRTENYLRISIGTEEEMETLVQAIREILGE